MNIKISFETIWNAVESSVCSNNYYKMYNLIKDCMQSLTFCNKYEF